MERRDLDPAVARLLEARPANIPDEPSLLRQPVRALVAVGSIVAIVSSVMPWAARTRIAGDVTRNGWQGLADGFLIAVVAVVLCVLTFNRSAVDSRMQSIRRLPTILGVTALLLWASGVQTMNGAIAIWRQQGYDGEYRPWLFVCLVGVLMLAAGGIWLGTRRVPKPADDPGRAAGRAAGVAVARVSGATSASVAFEAVGAVAGAVAADVAIIAAGFDGFTIALPLILGTVFGALFGAWLGARIGERLTRRPPT